MNSGTNRLFLIDHSLRDTGGHHFDYVRSVAGAARDSGLAVSIGCNRGFASSSDSSSKFLIRSLEELGEVKPVFRETVYQGVSWLAGLRRSKRAKPLRNKEQKQGRRLSRLRWPDRLHELRTERRRDRITSSFTAGCETFFQSLEPKQGDHVLVAAASELEIAGALDFLIAHPAARNAQWHFLFHFNLFEGWTPEYDSQREAWSRTRGDLMASLKQLAKLDKRAADSICFHATTETLVDQFNLLRVARFDHLPYPVSNDFLPVAKSNDATESVAWSTHEKPLSLVCAGATRREKGQVAFLQNLVDEIEDPLLRTGKVQLVVQRPKRKRFIRSKLDLKLSSNEHDSDVDAFKTAECNAIRYVAHPLPRPEYQELLRSADVGLFCYDSRSYFSRCAGILVEMLACGKPVIVPAGTWLSDQIEPSIQGHIHDFRTRHSSRTKVDHSAFQFDRENAPGPSGVWSFDERQHPFGAAMDCESDDQVALVRFDWHWPRCHGVYGRVACVQLDDSGAEVSAFAQAVGVPRIGESSQLLFRLEPSCRRLQFRLTNAFGQGTITIRDFSVELYSSNQIFGETPIGAVGVIAASPSEMPECVEEVVNHLQHYRESADCFSRQWVNRHHPQQTIDRMFGRQALSSRAA